MFIVTGEYQEYGNESSEWRKGQDIRIQDEKSEYQEKNPKSEYRNPKQIRMLVLNESEVSKLKTLFLGS
jgi:hypothetical protein